MHFKFWGQSLNKGTWLTVAAKDTNYFHQTVVITIKSCLSINQLLLTRAQHSMHFKGDPTFQSLQEVMNTISSLPLQEKGVGGIPLGMFLLQVVFGFTSMSLKQQDIETKLWKFPSRPSTREFISQRYPVCAWEFMEVRDQCKVSSLFIFYFIYVFIG